ncbi:DNA polymerase III, gamma/tau subunit [secondary endosymbiont of Heteropsylla cubana]|uniref:DNA polymerase III subunit delta' n=1 Tax=secondary endosymbiont of Heteropsylla cubana TaxID=134287 RepID=J7H0P0_9ENTR|nr:DNA polymerase III subunit delta' [secondary endosymbiont of Heteropsylla cubana]AFP85885.1 DNA polymerase III, gamma/tau subunit [secondary endosymbiont of Heteropsylla cubana]
MQWYPWLNQPYRKILLRYQKSSGHHALLLHSPIGNGEKSLCYGLSRWLLCQHPEGIKSCGFCHSCCLMTVGNHPDFYHITLEKDTQKIGIDQIRVLIDNLYFRSHQGGVKVILMLDAEQFTEQATNALLKILEEPPGDTYFLLGCHVPSRLLPTLKSRCLYWSLPGPNEDLGVRWLQKETGFKNVLSACVALRLSSNAPLAAEALLQPKRWKERLLFCSELNIAYTNGDFLSLLPLLEENKDNKFIYWLLTFIIDAVKWQRGDQVTLINIDRLELIATIATRSSTYLLHAQWRHWQQCLYQLQTISGLNNKLLLTHYLLNLEKSVVDAKIF